ncbi:MAG: DUF3737 family protein [Clostridia bacterium]|nr:DUF3737 family protein [Clostridia bacterium]
MESEKKIFDRGYFTGERALFGVSNAEINDSVFEDGESPLKHGKDLHLNGCLFRWKYPLWYCNNVDSDNCTFYEGARAGLWYSNNMTIKNAEIQAPKAFRRCDSIKLENVSFHNAQETLWNCSNIILKNVNVSNGPYFAMNCQNMEIDELLLDGNYSFDGASDIIIRNSKLLTKDAFWNSKNVTVYDSFISGEYLGWNSENLTLINCTVESLQGMCYINGLKMVNCKLINTTFAFEYSNVDVDIRGKVDSVFNPSKGIIKAEEIDDLIIEKDKIDPSGTSILSQKINKYSDKPEWTK